MGKVNLALVFPILVAAFLLLLTVAVAVPIYEHHYGCFVYAGKLSATPNDYVSIRNPDPNLKQALENPGASIFVSSFENMPKYDVASNHGNVTGSTNVSVEYNGEYYHIMAAIADPSPTPFVMFYIVLPICWVIFGVSLLVVRFAGRKAKT